jgi:hypothetical protein
MKTSMAILVCSLVGITPAPVMGTPIAKWTFENTPVPAGAGPYSPEAGSGSASGFHAGSAVYSSPAGNGSTHSFSSTVWAVGDYWQFSVSTLGFQNIALSWDQTSSSTGPRDFDLKYSIDGARFMLFASYTVRNNASPSWSSTSSSSLFSVNDDLSSIAALDDAPMVYF